MFLFVCLHIRKEEDVWSPGTVVTDGYKPPSGCWELDSDPLPEVITEPSCQSLNTDLVTWEFENAEEGVATPKFCCAESCLRSFLTVTYKMSAAP